MWKLLLNHYCVLIKILSSLQNKSHLSKYKFGQILNKILLYWNLMLQDNEDKLIFIVSPAKNKTKFRKLWSGVFLPFPAPWVIFNWKSNCNRYHDIRVNKHCHDSFIQANYVYNCSESHCQTSDCYILNI